MVDFELDKVELLELTEASKLRIELSKQLLLDLNAQTNTKEELLGSLSYALRSDAFIPSKSTITDLTSSGRLSFIKDKSLKNKLFKYYEDLVNKSEIATSNRDINFDNMIKWDNILEFGWQEFSVFDLNGNILQTLPNLDWHLDKINLYYIRYQEVLIISIAINWRQQQLYNSLLNDMAPLEKKLKLACSI